MTGLSNTILSVLSSTYLDDYSEDKRFHRILFRPSVAVQARELTQLQTILQNQISRFGDHIFKDGSIVEGVGITYYPKVHYLSLYNTFNTNTSYTVLDIVPKETLVTNSTDSNTAVRAVVKIAKQGYITQRPNTNRLYFDYIVTGKDDGNNDLNEFSEGDTLYFYDSTQSRFGELLEANQFDSIETYVSNSSFTASGYAYCVGVGDGIIYQKGFFSKVEPQVITVRDYSTDVDGYVVGFDTTESIIRETQDSSLYDNALGSPNANAPGAHRLKLSPTLVAKTSSDTSNTNFFAIIEFDGDKPATQKTDSEYNVLQEQLARRTYEESGDYVIYPFNIETRDSSNTDTFNYEISSGIAYVRGKRKETINTTRLESPRAMTTEVDQNVRINTTMGNYVICDEFLGSFDFENISEVTLYDTAENSISSTSGLSSPSGTIIGYANVKAVTFESGTKGLPDAQYAIYLMNIRMESGYSFQDVRCIYMTGAKADVVLQGGKAVLNDTNSSTLIYPIGIEAPKRLTDSGGNIDTDFNFLQISSGSIATTGNVVINLETPAAGADSERLTSSSASTLRGSAVRQYNIYANSNIYTANLTGTIAIQSGNTTITGSSSLFETELKAGTLIRINDGSSYHIRRVTGITSNTIMYINSSIASTNATCNFQEYFLSGSPLPVETVYINSDTQFTAVTGKTLDSGLGSVAVNASYPVNRNIATEAGKDIKKNIFVKINCSNNAAGTTGPFDLGLCDVAKINAVYVGTTYADTNPDRISWFNLDTGQRNELYDHSQLVLKPQYKGSITSSTLILVDLDVFTANTSAGIGFFSVDSYPINTFDTSTSVNITTSEIPSFGNLNLRSAIDFRPRKYNTAALATSAASATINPITSNNSFDVPTSGQHLPQPFSTFNADVEYYLPRYDLVNIDSAGNFVVQSGVPAVKPKPPFVDGDQSIIAEVFVPPYPSLTQRQGENNNRFNIIKVNIKTNRRYTMKDIGSLEERIKRMEYYMVLNSLEQSSKSLTIPDANGLDRFKNGIYADPFNSHKIGNSADIEYRISVDPQESILRPQFDSHYVDFKFNSSSSSNVTRIGSLILLNHTHETYIDQRFATKYRNATESIWDWKGNLTLSPSQDFAPDITNAPANQINIDLSEPWRQLAQTPFGSIFGEWREVSSQTTTGLFRADGSVITTDELVNNWAEAARDFAGNIRTVTESERIVDQLQVDTTTTTFDLGSYVQDISIKPYMRTRLVAFVSYNNKPRTTLHAFFDDVNVDTHCAPGELSGVANVEEGKEDRIVNRTGNFGDALVSDENGFACGIFRIPEATFRTGDRIFKLTNVSDLVTGSDAIISESTGIYSAENVAVTKSSTTINTVNPTISANRIIEQQTNIQLGLLLGDPIAQSFDIKDIPGAVTGVYITKIGLYFQSKDSTKGISVHVMEMNNGSPDTTKTLSIGRLNSSDITVSSDATVETIFTLDQPVFLLEGNEYAFMVVPDNNSPEYNIWVGETGGYDITSGEQVFSNPYSGVLFTSSNAKTWTSIQKEDIKFKLYRAEFTSSSGYAILENEDDEYLTLDGFTKASEGSAINIGDVVYNVNSTSNVVMTDHAFGIVQYIDEAEGKLYLDLSSGGFSANTDPHLRIYSVADPANTSLVTNTNLVAYGNVTSVDSLTYHSVSPKIQILSPAKTSFTNKFKGTSTSNVVDSDYTTINYGREYQYIDIERHAMSKSLEDADLSGAKSSTHRIDLSSESTLVSPAISLKRKASLFIENIINNTTTKEYSRYGDNISKYIGKTVTLADGQDAEDLRVYLTAYRPVDTDIKVYAKLKNASDNETFNSKVWTELNYMNGGDTVYSDISNVSDYREYEFNIGSTIVSHVTTNGAVIPVVGEIATSGSNTGIVTYVDNEYVTVEMTTGRINTGDTVTFSVAGDADADSVENRSAFANTNTDVYTPKAGSISITNNSITITGTGTAFTTDFTIGDRIRIDDGVSFQYKTITSIADATTMTVDTGCTATNAAAVYSVFETSGNDGIVEYIDTSGARYIGFKQFALKIVLTSSNPVRVPRLNDVRAIALQI